MLLIVVGIRTVKPERIATVARTGRVQQAVLAVTFVLTMLIPLQYAVLVGVGMSMILYVIRQSNQISLVWLRLDEEGHFIDEEPPAVLPPDTVLVLEPVGSLFFAAAPTFEALLPEVRPESSSSVVIVRLRGREDVGATLIDVLVRYADSLHEVGSKLVLASVQPSLRQQLDATGVSDRIGDENLSGPGRWRTDALVIAHDTAEAWVAGAGPAQPSD